MCLAVAVTSVLATFTLGGWTELQPAARLTTAAGGEIQDAGAGDADEVIDHIFSSCALFCCGREVRHLSARAGQGVSYRLPSIRMARRWF